VSRHVTINFTNRLEIGSNVFIATGCWLQARGGIVLEDEVQLGPYAVLVAGDHTQIDGSYRFGPSNTGPIRIGQGSWVAAHATVTKGVIIGRGALLAANSVATHDIPSYAMAGGVPARIIHKKSRIEVVRQSPVPRQYGHGMPCSYVDQSSGALMPSLAILNRIYNQIVINVRQKQYEE
jgi:acetyltransferase-like isoleucine patch superfamily enzyme